MAPIWPTFVHERKADFFETGLEFTTGEQQECCICYEPFGNEECDDNTSIPVSAKNYTETDSASDTLSSDGDVPEIGVKIKACGHEFGHRCVVEYFNSSEYGTCPLCRTGLFPTVADELDYLDAQDIELMETGSDAPYHEEIVYGADEAEGAAEIRVYYSHDITE